MHIEFLLEERSAEEALKAILPKILSDDVSFRFHVFQGKYDLLKNLPDRLEGYRRSISDDCRIIVLIDKDQRDCFQLKASLEEAAQTSGLVTKSKVSPKGNFQVVNRLAIEELETWFFGDPKAIQEAYPEISKKFHRQPKYRNPDTIIGTHKALERLLKRAGYYRGGLPKTAVAQKIAPHMEPHRNRSKSFQVFVEGLKACVGEKLLV